jgi:hypothetical protein
MSRLSFVFHLLWEASNRIMETMVSGTSRSDRRADEIRRKADRIAVLIVSTDYPLVDIAIERSNLRDEAEELFPDRIEIYDQIYESRFDRLIEQWRTDED